MSKKSDQVKSGFAALDSTERADVISFINDFQTSNQFRQIQLRSDMDKVSNKSVGPRNTNACECCGK